MDYPVTWAIRSLLMPANLDNTALAKLIKGVANLRRTLMQSLQLEPVGAAPGRDPRRLAIEGYDARLALVGERLAAIRQEGTLRFDPGRLHVLDDDQKRDRRFIQEERMQYILGLALEEPLPPPPGGLRGYVLQEFVAHASPAGQQVREILEPYLSPGAPRPVPR